MTLLEDEKIVLSLNILFIVDWFFDAEGSAHDYMYCTVRILGRQGVGARFPLEADALLRAERIGKVK